MFFLFVLGFIGSCFLYYRYTQISNKRLFFQSSLFRSLAGSALILGGALFLVNLLAPEKRAVPSQAIDNFALDGNKADLPAYLLKERGKFQYDLVHAVAVFDRYESYRQRVKNHFNDFTRTMDLRRRDAGYFGLGLFALEARDWDTALSNFENVSDTSYPYLHYCIGYVLKQQDHFERAAIAFEKELHVTDGNFRQSYAYLIDIYEEEQNYPALRRLIDYDEAGALFPEYLARMTLLKSGEATAYLYWLFRTIHNHVNLGGLIAAIAISFVWLVYLLRLDIFRPGRMTSLLTMFVAGCLSVFLVISFNDVFDLFSDWSRNDGFINDFFYCILMIGVPEETVKILPLMILILFRKRLREPIDYIIYASASALGFAFIENLLYFQELTGGIIHGRAYLAAIGHMVDTSFIAYGLVIHRFHNRRGRSLPVIMSLSFLAGAISHGIYDYLLYQDLVYLFFMFFIFFIQVWIIIVNNCLNNSSAFSYNLAPRLDQSRLFISLALTSIFALEYILVGFSEASDKANGQLLANSSSACFLIIFFSSNLSSFNLVRSYWRDVYFSSREKRGYGARPGKSLLVNWYFVNSIKAHNYVGTRITIQNDPYNRILAEVLDVPREATIVNRIMLYENNEPDPHWFIAKLEAPLPIPGVHQKYILIKLRYQEDSLLYEDEVQVYFKGIPDLELLKTPRRKKELFPFFGWACVSLSVQPVKIGQSTLPDQRRINNRVV